MVSGETKLCPVCDSVIDVDARRCSECNTDLSLFDVDSDGTSDVARVPAARNGKSIDDILDSIVKGKEVHADFFEDIKTIATNGSADDDILADAAVEPGVEFECPLCNAIVEVSATACPNCGVAFADEEGPAAGTPEARPPPPMAEPVDELGLDETRRPLRAGGPSPMERLWSLVESRRSPPEESIDRGSLVKELPRLVNEVKPLLLTAKKVGVDIGDEKELINEAIAHGKRRDVEAAVRLIRQARSQLEFAFKSQIAKRIEGVLVEAERAKATGAEVGAILNLCASATHAVEARDYATAADKVRAAKEEFDARSGGYSKARQELSTVRNLVADAKKLGMSLRDVDSYVSRGEAAMNAKNYDQAAGLAVQARQALLKTLPEVLQKEMRKARNALLDMKVRGGDLTKPVGLLKQASIHLKREEYADAARFVRLFRDEVSSG